MKKIIRLIVLLLIIIFTLSFYQIYLKDKNLNEFDLEIEDIYKEKIISTTKTKNNLIKDLRYEINLKKDKKYIVTSKLSEITFSIDGDEIVEMKKVTATIIDKNKNFIRIVSDLAKYNNSTYETVFEKNVKIKYIDNMISSEKMVFDFNNDIIKISKNVEYKGNLGHLFADNMDIDLLTNKFRIYMNDKEKNVRVISY